MSSWLFLPPIAFGLVLAAVIFLSFLAKKTSYRGPQGPGADRPYSCGEDLEVNSFRPEYWQFFSFAFFFTLMHVVALVLATVPGGFKNHYFMIVVYIAAALIGLSALMRKEK
jgi:NADH:ubiquinone oxidoreductase subunit 3 (subunit A)